jgi:CcmD family protein
MGFMIAAYFVIWLAVFVFVFSIWRRTRSLENEVATLKDVAAEKPAGN